MSSRQEWRWVATVAMVAIAACGTAPAAESSAGRTLPSVGVAEARTGTLALERVAIGRARPVRSAALSAATGGRVDELRVKLGDRVRAGEVLARLDASAEVAHAASRRAEVDRAAALLRAAQRSARSAEALTGTLAPDDVHQATAQAAAWRASVAAARAQLHGSMSELGRRSLTAPFDGVVVAVHVAIGDWAPANLPLVEVVDPTNVEIVLSLPPEVPLDPAMTTVAVAHGTIVTDARIAAIVPLIDDRSLAPTIVVRPAANSGILPGATVRVTFRFDSPRSAMVLPRDAVVGPPDHPYVFVVVDDEVSRRDVVVVATASTEILVQGDIEDGARVAVRGAGRLLDGDSVIVARGPEQESAP